MAKETVESRLADPTRQHLNHDLHQCAGVKHPDHPYKRDADIFVTPPHLSEGFNFQTVGPSAKRGVNLRCDECRLLLDESHAVILAAYDPNDTRVPQYLPPKPPREHTEVIDVPFESVNLASTPPWEA